MLWRLFLNRVPKSTSYWLLAALLTVPPVLAAQEPLHARIDKLLESTQFGPVGGLVNDEEFARRAYLDLTGAVPTIGEVKAFLADPATTKRAALIDRLLASPQFIRHMSTTFDVMLMERRPEKHVKQAEWQKYLYDSFAQNKSWNQLAREILAADGTDEKIRPAARFYLDREGEANLLTRDVGRILFGMDLGCCQCHDHPLIDAYEQYDYYGIYAFFSRGTLFTDKQKKVFYAEKAEGDVKFTSVFTKRQDEMRPRLPGEFELDEPAFLKGEDYTVAPADGVRPVPKYSRRARLAELATSGANRQFNRNIVNRIWMLLMGRGLVEPVDMHHVDNPAAHSELLEILADEFVKLKFDIKALVRELALTNVYQRSLRRPDDVKPTVQLAAQQLPNLEARHQQLAQALAQAIEADEKARADYDAARKVLTAGLTEFGTANEAVAAAQKAVQDTAKALAEAQQQLAAKKEIATVLQDAVTKAAEATAKLPDEKELAQAAEKFKSKAAQLAGEVTTAEKLVSDRTPPANASAEALTAAKNNATGLLEKTTAARQKIAELQQQLSALQEKRRIEQISVQMAKSRLDAARSLAEIGTILTNVDLSRKQLTELDGQLSGGKQMLAAFTAQLPQLEATFNSAKGVSGEAAKKLGESQTQLAAKQQAVQLLTETTAKAELASQKLPQDAELKQVFDTLKNRRDQLTAEATAMQKTVTEREQAGKAAAEQLAAAQQAMANARSQMETLQKSLPMLEAQLPAAQAKLASDETAARLALENAAQNWSKQFLLAPLEPLTPEQLAWSILKVSGVVDQYRVAAEAEISKTMPLEPNVAADPAKVAEREKLIEQNVYDKLTGNVATFIGLFGHAGGQPQRDFFATVDQALFFANAGVLQSWLNPSGDNLVARLIKLNEPRAVAEELYMSVLIRRPSDEEVGAVSKYLEGRPNDRALALQEIAWALITSTEFRFQ